MKLFDNVLYPYPGRRLTGIVSVQKPGRRFHRHKYFQNGSHQETLDDGTRVSIRHYECAKCGRLVHVYGPIDERSIEGAIQNRRLN